MERGSCCGPPGMKSLQGARNLDLHTVRKASDRVSEVFTPGQVLGKQLVVPLPKQRVERRLGNPHVRTAVVPEPCRHLPGVTVDTLLPERIGLRRVVGSRKVAGDAA